MSIVAARSASDEAISQLGLWEGAVLLDSILGVARRGRSPLIL